MLYLKKNVACYNRRCNHSQLLRAVCNYLAKVHLVVCHCFLNGTALYTRKKLAVGYAVCCGIRPSIFALQIPFAMPGPRCWTWDLKVCQIDKTEKKSKLCNFLSGSTCKQWFDHMRSIRLSNRWDRKKKTSKLHTLLPGGPSIPGGPLMPASPCGPYDWKVIS